VLTLYILKKIIKDWIVPIISALIIALLINKFIFFLILVPTGSMDPTIKPGDRVLVFRIYNKDNLKRGDIVVFYSDELEKPLVKRLIGLPNDEIEIKSDGSVYINNERIEEPYVINDANGITKKFNVPSGKYFFLGDNRANSYDSRYWDDPYISQGKIEGKAVLIVFPFNRIDLLTN
jgi:signal peptidase I